MADRTSSPASGAPAGAAGIDPDRLASVAAGMPSFPAGLLRVRRALGDVGASTEDLTAMVAMDAGLTVAVMRLANSARYGVSGRRFSLAQSIGRIGRTELRALVDTLCVRHILRSISPQAAGAAAEVDAAAIWRFSLEGAFAARHWAAHLPSLQVDRQEAYTVALFRDLGRIHTDAVVSDGDIRSEPDQRLRAEREGLGFTHAELSAQLLRRWQFPDHVAEALAAHHQADGPPLALIAQLGDRAAVAVEPADEETDARGGEGQRPDPFPMLEERLRPLLPAPRTAWNAVVAATRDDLSAYTTLLQAA